MGGFQKNAGGRGPLKHEDALAFLQRAESATGASVYEHLTSVVQEVRSPPTLVPPPLTRPQCPSGAPRTFARSRPPSLPSGAPGMHGGARGRGARARGPGGRGGPVWSSGPRPPRPPPPPPTNPAPSPPPLAVPPRAGHPPPPPPWGPSATPPRLAWWFRFRSPLLLGGCLRGLWARGRGGRARGRVAGGAEAAARGRLVAGPWRPAPGDRPRAP